ncbi:potassium channel family protein [Streptomyces sp. 1222.5]|uniref:potassium channel family protein n=1 Tax=Streptomyces sp. 1222.5 TaxID=1881026 RepID=UPI003EBF1EEE
MIAATLAGIALIAVTGADLLITVLHPSRSGALSRVVIGATWRLARTVASWPRAHAVFGYVGPVMMLAQLVTWVVGLWVGFAVIYASHLDQIVSSPQLRTNGQGLLDAFYLSGVALTTVGFGDVVAGTAALRLVTVAEGATGLAVFGAGIAYLLAVYPLVSQIRVTARQLAAIGDYRGAAELIVHGGNSRLEALQRDLIQLDESTQRFPVLYYFHAEDPRASLTTAIRAASLVMMQLRFGLSTHVVPHARWHGRVLEATLTRVLDRFQQRYHHPASVDREERLLSEADVNGRIGELRRAAAQVTGTTSGEEPDREAFSSLVVRSNTLLAELERRHLYPYQPL